tara:strand:- start:330 stop:647 length:318 start_codon:yes stop_codon:yes gene_type:complete
MQEQHFQPLNALASTAYVAALPAKGPPIAGQAIVGTEDNRAAPEYIYFVCGVQHGPTDGTVTDVEGKMKGVRILVVFGIVTHDGSLYCPRGIKTKLDNAVWLPVR